MSYDIRREKLKANLIAGMSKGEAARAAGFSESYCKVNVYAVTKTAEFQAELEQARIASQGTSPMTSQPTSVTHLSTFQTLSPLSPDSEQFNPDGDLTVKEQLFRDYYLGQARFNGTLAARMAGYSGDDNALASLAHHLLRKPKIQSSVRQVLSSAVMGREEVLQRLSQQARASIADVLDDSGDFDLNLAKERGTDGLVRKIKTRKRIEHGKDGSMTEYLDHDVEIHDSQKALTLMGNHHGVLGDTPETFEQGVIERRELVIILQAAMCACPEDFIDVTPEPSEPLEPREISAPIPEPVVALPPANGDPTSKLPSFLFRQPLNDCPTE